MLHGRRKVKMRNKAFDLSSYSFSVGEQILVDTNIWLYLFPPPGNPPPRFAIHYSQAFLQLVKAKAQPILDPMVLSEYLNRYARIEWEGQDKTRFPNFKSFRNSPDFQAIASSIGIFAKKIIGFCIIHSIPANQLDLAQALTDFLHGGVDFNDAILVDVCRKKNIKLMTNDGDFQYGGIEVLTSNTRLLQTCP